MPRRVLIINMSVLGDVLAFLPTLAALRRVRPADRLFLLCAPVGRTVLQDQGLVDQLIPFDLGRTKRGIGHPRLTSTLALARRIRRLKCDLLLDDTSSATTSRWVPLFGIRESHGYDGTRTAFLYRHRIPRAADRHIVLSRRRLLDHAGLLDSQPLVPIRWRVPDRARKHTQKVLDDLGSAPLEYAVIHPGAGSPWKRWPGDRFAEVLRWVQEERGLVPLLVGVEEERSLAESIAESAGGRARSLAGRLTLGETAALLEGARFYLGNESGPMHLAAALQVPSIILWSHYSARFVHPFSPRSTLLACWLDCHPCRRPDRCTRQLECLLGIQVDQVRRALDELLGRPAEEYRGTWARIMSHHTSWEPELSV